MMKVVRPVEIAGALTLCSALALCPLFACGGGGGATGGTTGAGSGGRVSTGGAPGAGGGGATGTGGGVVGSGGVGPTGSGGATTGGATGSGGAGSGGAGGSATGGAGTATGGAAGGAPGPTCPANATFCANFETSDLPTGAVYKVNAAPGDWLRDFAYDPSNPHVGRGALRVKASTESGTSGSAYKMLSVPAPMTSFWVRFYILSELDMGAVDHNPFAEASGSDEPNDSTNLEFADDAGIAFNYKDDVRWPTGYTRDNRFTLVKNVWHCIEIFYDSSPARNQQLIINGTQRINITAWPTTTQLTGTFRVFKFGFNELHGPPRKTWYDDVVVAPQRIPCL